MSIITISRGSYSRGQEIAEKVSALLGYECISREAIIEAAKEFNIPEAKLVRAVHNAPSMFNRFTHGKERYIAYVQAALTERVKKDNIVYHGLAGHFLLQGIDHVLKVRITADLTYRTKIVMERDNVSEKEALNILMKDDNERKKWSRTLYGIDTTDSSLYDLVIHIDRITVEDAVNIIAEIANLKDFRTSEKSRRAIENLALACKVRSYLIDSYPDIEISANDGLVTITASGYTDLADALTREIKNKAMPIPGVKGVRIEIHATPRISS